MSQKHNATLGVHFPDQLGTHYLLLFVHARLQREQRVRVRLKAQMPPPVLDSKMAKPAVSSMPRLPLPLEPAAPQSVGVQTELHERQADLDVLKSYIMRRLVRQVKRMLRATLVSGLVRWCQHARKLRWKRNMLEQMALRMRNATAYKAYATWSDNANELVRQRGVLERMALRLRNALMYKGWATWGERTAEIRRQRSIVEKVVLRLGSAGVVKAYAAWADKIRELRRQRGVMEQVMMRRERASVEDTFAQWWESARKMRAECFIAAKDAQLEAVTKSALREKEGSLTIIAGLRQHLRKQGGAGPRRHQPAVPRP